MKTLLSGGLVVFGDRIEKIDVEFTNHTITKIGPHLKSENSQKIDCTGLHILPGLIDTQVHFREPGLTHKEDIGTGSMGAALGGLTGYFEMPNTNPSTTTPEKLREKVEIAKKNSWVDFAFYMGASDENAELLNDYSQTEGCCGIKIFMGSSTGSLLVEDDQVLSTIFSKSKTTIAIHSEEEKLLKARESYKKAAKSVHDHPLWRSVETALASTKRIIELAKKTQKKVHILHLTTAEEIEFLKNHKDLCTIEVTPQHLTFFAPDCYDQLDTLAQMNPPIREKYHQDRLWKAIDENLIDIIGSDHAPHTLEEKNKGYPNTPSGMTGVQTIVPVMLNHVNHGKLSLSQLTKLMAINPVKIWGLKNKGEIAIGRDADFTIVDMKLKQTITDSWIVSRSKWSPYHQMPMTGWPVKTFIRGHLVLDHGKINKIVTLPYLF